MFKVFKSQNNFNSLSSSLMSLFSTQKSSKFDFVYGLNPTMIALHSNKRNIVEVIINQHVQSHLPPKISNIINTANAKKIPVKFVDREKLDRLVQNQPHQNVVIKAEPLKYLRTKSSDILQGNMILFLDRITDPQNFGAIIRTCQYLGVDNVVVDEFSRCPLNPTVSKTSSGALEVMDIYCTPDPVEFLKDCQLRGWKVYSTGLNHSENQISLEKLKVSSKDKIVLVMGNEGNGVDPKILKVSDKIVSIDQTLYLNRPMVFPYTLIDSLNVNSATSILIQNIKLKMIASEKMI
ncbi:TrmH family RNA methyltransferase (macronuclear) [Tetrahymena thermophila SB210]|uniref:rRNA methyltransferase 1, mitochondrial n=1 Tax=Tetrahymena thermophila (strain SB210) TaxID=312017 RepID=I7MJ42_TETTS|nr:TrmH family RNA methyltransferase [Tetrahymena thermophila SB210]EAS05046.2 TrmH family RNA methyltransferase [Tetrahymena thermophila SB210]|eukprot:XP_001025291.2 TrmH family RNA methyltransferase [Tetrahymena thermophila SB210]